jgi:hypothetical protein
MTKPPPNAAADYARSVHATLGELIEQTHRLYRSITDNARKTKAPRKGRKRSFNLRPPI